MDVIDSETKEKTLTMFIFVKMLKRKIWIILTNKLINIIYAKFLYFHFANMKIINVFSLVSGSITFKETY